MTAGRGERLRRLPTDAVGGLLGGFLGAAFAAATTEVIKRLLAVVARQETWVLIVVPLVGLSVSVVVLHVIGHGAAVQHLLDDDPRTSRRRWRAFPTDVTRADLTADVVANAGREERFPWHLAPVRAMAIVATVGLGAPMGTESPAAHLGMAAGSAAGDRIAPLRRYARPMALGGGAAAVAALMGLPLVGAVFMLELGRRRQVAISPDRVVAALAGGLAGWTVNVAFDLDLIRLVSPRLAPHDVGDAVATALLVGAAAGAVCATSGAAIYRARAWRATPGVRLLLGGLAVAAAAVAIAIVATPDRRDRARRRRRRLGRARRPGHADAARRGAAAGGGDTGGRRRRGVWRCVRPVPVDGRPRRTDVRACARRVR